MGNTWSRKSESSQIEEVAITPPTLLAWSSWRSNNIRVIELENKENYANFQGVQITEGECILYF